MRAELIIALACLLGSIAFAALAQSSRPPRCDGRGPVETLFTSCRER